MNIYIQNSKYSQDKLKIQYPLDTTKTPYRRIKEHMPKYMDMEDLICIGTEELENPERGCNPGIDNSFLGCAKTRTSNALLDFLLCLDVISTNTELIKNIDSKITKYYNQYQEESSNEYVPGILNQDFKKIKETRTASDVYPVPTDKQYEIFYENGVFQKIEKEILIEKIKEALQDLSEMEEWVIRMVFFEKLNLVQIRQVLGITESRISQIIEETIKEIIRRKVGMSCLIS